MSATSSMHHRAPWPSHRQTCTHTYTDTHTHSSLNLPELLIPVRHMRVHVWTCTHTNTHAQRGRSKESEGSRYQEQSRQTAFGQCVMDGWMLVLLNCCKSCAIYHFKSIIVYPLKLQVQPEWAVPFIIWPPGWPPGCHKWRWSMDQHSTGSTGNKNILSLRYWFGTMQSDSSFKCV